jgi:hypothetical protein
MALSCLPMVPAVAQEVRWGGQFWERSWCEQHRKHSPWAFILMPTGHTHWSIMLLKRSDEKKEKSRCSQMQTLIWKIILCVTLSLMVLENEGVGNQWWSDSSEGDLWVFSLFPAFLSKCCYASVFHLLSLCQHLLWTSDCNLRWNCVWPVLKATKAIYSLKFLPGHVRNEHQDLSSMCVLKSRCH